MHCSLIGKKLEFLKDVYHIEEAKEKERRIGMVKGLALGAIIGGLIGILYAPDKGDVTRAKTKEELLKAKDMLEDHLEEGKDKGTILVEEQKERLEEIWLSTKNRFNKPEEEEETSVE